MEWELAGDKAQQMEGPRDKLKKTHFTRRHGSSWAAGQGPESELSVRKTLGVATAQTREDALVAATAQGGPLACSSTPRAHNLSLSQSPSCPSSQELSVPTLLSATCPWSVSKKHLPSPHSPLLPPGAALFRLMVRMLSQVSHKWKGVQSVFLSKRRENIS